MTASSPSPCRLNGVGYNTALNTQDTLSFIGASFEGINETGIIPFNSLTCPEGLSDGDGIQTAFTDPDTGSTNLKLYEYWEGDGWADLDLMEPVDDTVGLNIGSGAWFSSASPKSITIAGSVKKGTYIHTITDPLSIVASAFPVDFCPNGENVSWGCPDGSGIQVPFTDPDTGSTNLKLYEYWEGDGWADLDMMEPISADCAITTAGKGFWFVTGDPTSTTFAEVGPLAE